VTIPSVRFVCQCDTIGWVFGSWDQISRCDGPTWISDSLGVSSAPLINFFKCTSLRFGMYRVKTRIRIAGFSSRYVLQNGKIAQGRILDLEDLELHRSAKQRCVRTTSHYVEQPDDQLNTVDEDTSDIGTSTETLRLSFQSPNSIPFSKKTI